MTEVSHDISILNIVDSPGHCSLVLPVRMVFPGGVCPGRTGN